MWKTRRPEEAEKRVEDSAVGDDGAPRQSPMCRRLRADPGCVRQASGTRTQRPVIS